ncbi:hypothetical protein DIPPA_11361 [Diplonema papillatum]|nr:hypothetical protein DIPPA_11361 [Diplonema papillatum]
MPLIQSAQPHDSVKDVFGACKHVYLFRFVKRVSRKASRTGQERILIASATDIFMCDLDAHVKRVVRLRDIDKVFIQEKRGGARFIFTMRAKPGAKDPYPFMFDSFFLLRNRDANDWYELLQVVNKLRMAVTGMSLPAQRIDPEENVDDLLNEAFGHHHAREKSEDENSNEPARLASLTEHAFETVYNNGPLKGVNLEARLNSPTANGSANKRASAERPKPFEPVRKAEPVPKGESTPKVQSVAGAESSGVGQRMHPGEWRGTDRDQWCSLQSKVDGPLCTHGDTIQRPHWSCCGRTMNDAEPCLLTQASTRVPHYRISPKSDSPLQPKKRTGDLHVHGDDGRYYDPPKAGVKNLHAQVRTLSHEPRKPFLTNDDHPERPLVDGKPRTGKHDARHPFVAGMRKKYEGKSNNLLPERASSEGDTATTDELVMKSLAGVKQSKKLVSPVKEQLIRRLRRRQGARDLLSESVASDSTFKPFGEPVPGKPLPPHYAAPPFMHDPLMPEVFDSFDGSPLLQLPSRKQKRSHKKYKRFPGAPQDDFRSELPSPDELVRDMDKAPPTRASYFHRHSRSHLQLVGAPRTSPVKLHEDMWANIPGPTIEDRPREKHHRHKSHKAVKQHKKQLRNESNAIVESIFGPPDTNASTGKGSLCDVVVRAEREGEPPYQQAPTVKRRFAVVEWEGLGPCVVLTTLDKEMTGLRPESTGWTEYMQCSHLRKAGYASNDLDTIILSTGLQHWLIHMSTTAAAKWLAVVYDCCYWLRPTADGTPYTAPGHGTLPPGTYIGSSNPILPTPLTRTTLKQNAGAGKLTNIVQIGPGVHTSVKPETLQPSRSDWYAVL